MEEQKTYAVVTEEYYFNFNAFQTLKKYNVLTVTNDSEKAEEILGMYDMVLAQTRDAQETDKNGNMLTSYSINNVPFEGNLTIDEVKELIAQNQNFEWGQSQSKSK